MNKFFLICIISCTYLMLGHSQNNRTNIYSQIGWYNFFGTAKISEKMGLHTEYQWRRDDIITHWQQSLVRVGINYSISTRSLFRLGYAHIETWPYGEIPINGLGRNFTEHRIFQMIQLTQKEGIIDLSHRFMLEQRFVGKYSSAAVAEEDEFPLLHRMRYMVRLQAPLKGKEIKDKTPYLAFYNEILIGFGKNVNANIFDQNRIGLLVGYRFSKNIRIEGGYLNQIVQFGRLINGSNVFQYNNGIVINANLNLDLRKAHS